MMYTFLRRHYYVAIVKETEILNTTNWISCVSNVIMCRCRSDECFVGDIYMKNCTNL